METVKGRANVSAAVESSVKDQFWEECKTLGLSPSVLLRELIVAVVEHRLTIKPTKDQKVIIRGIHHVD